MLLFQRCLLPSSRLPNQHDTIGHEPKRVTLFVFVYWFHWCARGGKGNGAIGKLKQASFHGSPLPDWACFRRLRVVSVAWCDAVLFLFFFFCCWVGFVVAPIFWVVFARAQTQAHSFNRKRFALYSLLSKLMLFKARSKIDLIWSIWFRMGLFDNSFLIRLIRIHFPV